MPKNKGKLEEAESGTIILFSVAYQYRELPLKLLRPKSADVGNVELEVDGEDGDTKDVDYDNVGDIDKDVDEDEDGGRDEDGRGYEDLS